MKKQISTLVAALLAIGILTPAAYTQPAFPGEQRNAQQDAQREIQRVAFAGGRVLPIIDNDAQQARILHLLNRITFGPTSDDIAYVQKVGIDQYIREQLNPQTIQVPDDLARMVANTQIVSGDPLDLVVTYGRQALMQKAKDSGNTDKKAIQKQIGQTYRKLFQDMLVAKVRRNIESPRQLEEVMTDFWFNHFNISINKGPFDRFLVGSFEQRAIRPYALGKFRDLLEATAHHPAMLFYLDNWENTAPGSAGARGRFKGINENYARELMELHTLGVDGGYTQQDVVALAHILTGLGFPNARQLAMGRVQPGPEGAYFDANRHDFGTKQFLGRTISGTGEQEIEQALDILAMHPSTAHHISYQLAQYFVSDNPPASLVDKLSQTYLHSGGDIKTVMNALLHSPEFWDGKYTDAKYKSPYHYAISVARASGVQLRKYQLVGGFLTQLGEPLYGCLTPDGYKNTQEAWLNSDGLLKRINFAAGVARGMMGPVPPDEIERVQLALGSRLSKQTLTALANAPDGQRAGLMMGSPEFMKF